ncbi:hypothetical protein LMH87_012282 [Akanthomyces muscarius]|uniref:Uncharacterized protein n=1 Tax=Akanthomyces muscarius TaxID=2231603 RepID=A0A9W8QD19_AKAMU|nr:hypothetical protein LMH87_012282 [Akanthomyces muscarius]KAJ4151592.1 hypothetical protein LMH87_012282 [Akanthomyces muscarius]
MADDGAQRLVLAPSTPAAFLSHLLNQRRHPTTALICATKHDFLHAAVSELQDAPPSSPSSRPDDQQAPSKHAILKATLAHIATSRHIQTAFVPSVAHLRAYLSVFPSATTTVPAPPEPQQQQQERQQPALLVYGFLDVHRDGGEWSAQGIGCSAACVVEAAARAGLAAALMEPQGWGAEQDETGSWAAVYEEQIPLLSSTAEVREDGTWAVPCTSARTILRRWFTLDYSQT